MCDAKKETSKCPSPETLKKYLDGALCWSDADALALHLRQCEPCLEILIELSPKPATPEEQAEAEAQLERVWHWFEENVLNAKHPIKPSPQ